MLLAAPTGGPSAWTARSLYSGHLPPAHLTGAPTCAPAALPSITASGSDSSQRLCDPLRGHTPHHHPSNTLPVSLCPLCHRRYSRSCVTISQTRLAVIDCLRRTEPAQVGTCHVGSMNGQMDGQTDVCAFLQMENWGAGVSRGHT